LFGHTLAVTENNYVAANLLGKAYEKNGQAHSARLYYLGSVRMQPRFPQSQFNLAMSQFAAGAVAEGLPHLEAAAEMKRDDPQIQSDLGLIFAQYASWTNAVICFSNSVARRPVSAETQFSYAVALVNLGRFADAVPHYVAALRLKPDFEAARDQLTRLVAEHPELLKAKP
jgi:Flp pilus assembly protein TadD